MLHWAWASGTATQQSSTPIDNMVMSSLVKTSPRSRGGKQASSMLVGSWLEFQGRQPAITSGEEIGLAVGPDEQGGGQRLEHLEVVLVDLPHMALARG